MGDAEMAQRRRIRETESAIAARSQGLAQGPKRARAREAQPGTPQGMLAFALIQATVSGNLREAKLLVQRRGADPNIAVQGFTPLLAACGEAKDARPGALAVVRWLLAEGGADARLVPPGPSAADDCK